MTVRTIIVHGWADDPTRGWMGWLERTLHAEGEEVIAPQLPGYKHPDVEEWIGILAEQVGDLRADDIFIAHSLGCAVSLRYIHDALGGPIAGGIFVAGALMSKHTLTKSLFQQPLGTDLLQQKIRKRVCMYADDDEWVDPARTKLLATELNAELIEDPGKGHFRGLAGVTELPSALKAHRMIRGATAGQ